MTRTNLCRTAVLLVALATAISLVGCGGGNGVTTPTPRLPDPTVRHMADWTCVVAIRSTPTSEWRQLHDTGADGVMVGALGWEYSFYAFRGPILGSSEVGTAGGIDAQCRVTNLVTLRNVPTPHTSYWKLPVGWYQVTWQIGGVPAAWPYYTLHVMDMR